MATKTVDIVEAQANLPELVSLASAGVEVVLTKNSAPVACLVPMESPSGTSSWLGCLEHLHASATEEDITAAQREMWANFPRESAS